METNIKSKKRIKSNYNRKNRLQLLSLCILPMLKIFIFSYLPMVGIIIAFKDYRYDLGVFGSKWVGLDNFTYFFKTNDFWRITYNTLTLNALMIACGMVAALSFGIALFELRKNVGAVKAYQTISIVPHFLSWVVVGSIAYCFLQPEHGILNQLFQLLNIPEIDWYSEPGPWVWILTLVSIWKHVGMDSVIYYATMTGIDSALYEAAMVDGANRWQRIRHITIPALVPTIIILFIMKIGSIFRADFGLFYQLTRNSGALQQTTDVIDTYIFRTMTQLQDYSTSSAMGLLQSVVGFTMVVTVNAVVKRVKAELSLF